MTLPENYCILVGMKAEKKHWKDREMRITDLAQKVGVGHSHMSLIMSGKRMPSLEVAKRIATQMGVSLDEFYDRLSERVAA